MTTEITTEKKQKQRNKNTLKFPKKYKVVICNDDVTPVDFVIVLLMSVFRHSSEEAKNITLTIHNNGKGVAGIYNYEIAEQKTIDSTSLSRYHGWPLMIKLEEE